MITISEGLSVVGILMAKYSRSFAPFAANEVLHAFGADVEGDGRIPLLRLLLHQPESRPALSRGHLRSGNRRR